VQCEEAAKGDAPFDRGEGVGVAEHVLALQIVELLDRQAVVLLAVLHQNLITLL
jgi:hypothetical protein